MNRPHPAGSPVRAAPRRASRTLPIILAALAGCQTTVEEQRESFSGHEGLRIGGVGVEEYLRARKVRLESGALITEATRMKDGRISCSYMVKADPSAPADGSLQFSMPAIGRCLAVPLDQPGLFLTAAHATRHHPINLVYETESDIRFAEAHVVWVDEEVDLALLEADLGTVPAFPVAPEVRDDALVVAGCAAGPSAGTIRSHAPRESGGSAPLTFLEVMHDAPMRDGDSGAPLIDAEGRLVGVHSSTGFRLAGLRKSRRAFLPSEATLERLPAEAPNAATEYERLFQALAGDWEPIRTVREDAVPLLTTESSWDAERWRTPMAICGTILEGMDRASRISFCRFTRPRETAGERPWLVRAVALARVNAAWTWHQVVTRNFPGALRGWTRGFALARHVAQAGDTVDGQVGLEIADVAIDSMRRAVVEDRLEPGQLSDLSMFLYEQPYGVLSLRPAFRGERRNLARLGEQWLAAEDPLVALDEFIRRLPVAPGSGPGAGLDRRPPRERQLALHGLPAESNADISATREVVKLELADLLRRLAAAEVPAAAPWNEARDAIRSALEIDDASAVPANFLARLACPSLLGVLKSRMACESRLRGLRGMISLRQWMKQHDAIPLPGSAWLPADTCTGEAMRLEFTDSELVFRCSIESPHPDRDDRGPFYRGEFRLPIPEALRHR